MACRVWASVPSAPPNHREIGSLAWPGADSRKKSILE
eukprot:CAMPEP_0198687354 /NCGR_PEP_ID=MMETSP1468-20131203/53457_1 /TAXON_ID=1461545 /ORGANISM="Mantoniella sp, Strain CCMP1436" /LENGTH=36 /DNA_ID= /DNA_START= /DNA_END= /DNA_ORIENTATION=